MQNPAGFDRNSQQQTRDEDLDVINHYFQWAMQQKFFISPQWD